MLEAMPLIDAVFRIHEYGDRAVICAKEPFVWGIDAVIVDLDAEYRVPGDVAAAGFKYFLGRDDVVENLQLISKKRASREAQVEFLCHYAIADAYPAWFNDLVDGPA